MFKKKKFVFLLAMSALLAACGGGGDNQAGSSGTTAPGAGNTLPSAGTTNNGAAASGSTSGGGSTNGTSGNGSITGTSPNGTAGTGTSSSGTTSSGTTSSGSSSSGSSSSGTSATNSGTSAGGGTSAGTGTTTAATDQLLRGYLEMVNNQIVYIRTNRVIYLPVTLNQFESDSGIVDVASGSPTDHVDIDVVAAHCDPAIDGRCGIQPTAAAPAAPLAAFGLRIEKYVLPSSTGQAVANQTVVGRIAVDLTERNDSPGVAANEVPEIMRFIIDKVALTTDQNGQLISAKLQDGAQIHVYGRNAAGVEVRENIPAPPGTVRILPMSEVPDNHGDTSSFFLLLDLEAGFSQAGQKLAALEKIAGHFAMRVTLSSVQRISRPAQGASAESPALEQKDLIGQQITVNDQPPVNGAGIVGNTWIRMYPMP